MNEIDTSSMSTKAREVPRLCAERRIRVVRHALAHLSPRSIGFVVRSRSTTGLPQVQAI